MNKTFQYNNLSYYYSPNFKKNTGNESKNKSGNITGVPEISKKILPNNGDQSRKNGSENYSFISSISANVNNNIREDKNKQEPQQNGESLFNKMDNLINEIRTQIKEMKDGSIKIDTLIEEMKSARISSESQIKTFIEEMKSARIASENQMNTFIEEMKKARIASENQMNSFIEEMKEDRKLSKKQHEELMEKFKIIY